MTERVIAGAKAFLPDGIVETTLRVSDGVIVEIGGPVYGTLVTDGRGLMLAPALVDLHGDAFERQVMPRPGVYFPLDTAILDTDRQLAANGIATAYHALTLSWEPGLRGIDRGRDFMEALCRIAPRLTVENRVQLRWETFALDAVDLIVAALSGPLTPSVAFNDHTSMTMRDFDVSIQDRLFEQDPDYAVASFDDARLAKRVAPTAHRSGVSTEAYLDMLRDVWAARPGIDGSIRKVADAARAAGAPMLSHDDTQIETRQYYREIGAGVAEFPMVLPVAEEARASGDVIAFGAPNAVRGGSHIGSLGAGDMVEAGLCDALASDYFYPAMLAAVARLDAEKRADRSRIWSLVSEGPARAMGLADRGRIEVGLRADLVLLDWPEGGTPAVRETLVAGRTAYRGDTAT
ncbi:MAG: alpha-D-ribose 1-methylphosphonate 5-triphosphate diphosphatase [Pseudomonadota bacterium]